MVQYFQKFLLILFMVLGLPVVVQAQSPGNEVPTSVPATSAGVANSEGVLTGAEIAENEFSLITQSGGPSFRAGDTVVVTEPVSGDIYIAGGMVRIESSVAGDVLVAGGQVTVNGPVGGNIRALGGTLTIRSEVAGSVSAVGGNVILSPGSSVGESLVAAAGNLSVEGDVGNDIVAGVGNIELLGTVGRDVRIGAGAISLLSGSAIGGNFYATVDEDAAVLQQGEISGEVSVSRQPFQAKGRAVEQQVRDASAGAVVGQAVATLAMGILGGAVLLMVFPGVLTGPSGVVRTRPMASFGWGALMLVAAPILAIISVATIVGIPVGVLVLFSYIMALISSVWITGLALGRWLYSRTSLPVLQNVYVQLAGGLVILQIIGLVPVLGWLVKFVALIVGLGALSVHVYELRAGAQQAAAVQTSGTNSPRKKR